MTKAVGRALAAAVLAGLLGAAFMAFWFVVHPRLDIGFETDPPRLLGGIYPAERDPATGLTFAWSGQELALRIPGLDRSVDWTLELRVRGARQAAGDNPTLSFFGDGVLLATAPTHTDFESISVVVPASPARPRGVVIVIQSSATFVPGSGDPRSLGVMIDRVSLSPDGVALPPRRAFAGAALSAAVLGAAVALLGVTTGNAVGAAVLLSAAAAAMLSRGFGPYTDYPVTAVRIAAWIGVCLTLLAAAVEWRQHQPLRNTARFVAAFSAGALFLKLLVLLHPDMPVGDAMFHAHRFQGVLAGNLYFTSTAPGNYLFPYAPGLYVFAAPFARLIPRGADDMALLRVVAVTADTVAASLLYVVIVRRWSDRIAAAMAVALYHLVPLDFRIMSAGNLTNAFAQSLSVVVLATLGAAWVRWERPASVILLTAALSAAFMSHTSTFAILFVACLSIIVLFVWKGGPDSRSPALALSAATVGALVLAVALYYAHFFETYRTELARIGAETAARAPDAGGRGIGARLASVPRYLHEYLGAPVLMLAAAGGWYLRQRPAVDRLTLSIAGWSVSCALFLLLGVLTPVDMRYYLASIPAVAIAAAAGASALWSGGRDPRIAAALLLAWVLWIGIRTWWTTLL